MNKFIYFIIFIILSGCSLNKNSKFWSSTKEIEKEVLLKSKSKIEEIFKEDEVIIKEFNQDLNIKINGQIEFNKKNVNYTNNDGLVNFDGSLKSISKYKYSKIKNFYQYEPEIVFYKNNIIFFDNKGTIIMFDENSKLIWKKNYYSKTEQKQNPVLQFVKDGKNLVVADNLANYFKLDIETGELIWSKKNLAPFNSQIKIYSDTFFIIDFSNTLRCFSLKNGDEIWSVGTQNSLIRSQKKLSMVILKDIVYFNNSIGDISAVDLNNGELLWQLPTQNNLIYESAFSLETSDIVADNKTLYFSNNQNQFFSIDLNSGSFNWEAKINSNVRPTIIGNVLFTVSMEGFLFLVNKINGNIVRVTDVFDNFKSKHRNSIKPTGFIVGKKNIYLSTNNGRLIVIDIVQGKAKSTLKIDKEKILRPNVSEEKLFVAKDNAIIRLN